MIYDCIIIGAGASGLFAASSFEKSIKGLILEKTARPGTKLLMSGSGQCNITHSGSIKDFISHYGKNGSKIRSCLYKNSNIQLISFLETNGVKTMTRPDGKVFPASLKASDILSLLKKKAAANGFETMTDSPALRIAPSASGGSRWIVECRNKTYECRNIIIATGGSSFPKTGSDGSFLKTAAENLSLSVVKPVPALTAVSLRDYPFGELSGIAFENVRISVLRDNKKVCDNTDDLLFTHNDLSGPVILNASKNMAAGDRLVINYLYPATYEEVLADLKNAISFSKSSMANIISDLFGLPKRFSRLMHRRYGNSPKEVAKALTGETFIIASPAGFQKAMATAGGIALSEIHTATMELKKHAGIFAVGEVCDIDGETGGYNLQFAYSSARSAAMTVSAWLSES